MKQIRYLIFLLLLLMIAVPITAQANNGTHVVQSGENLFRIALRYGITTDELANANNISDVTRIFAGQELLIPGLDAADESDEIANPLVAAAPVSHIIQQGESLRQIAILYGVTVDQLISANNIANPDTIFAGQELQIWTSDLSVAPVAETAVVTEPEPEVVVNPAPVEEAQSAVHIVAPGEYLSGIARSYGIPWTTIAEANNIVDPNRVIPGTQLIIPGADPSIANGNIIGTTPSIASNIPDPGAHWGVGREIVVDLSTQMTYAYENGALQFSALVSTGLPATPTVQGEYAIWHKTPSQTMSGPGYYLPNVQWVMYFYQGYGFHGTYWHSNYGNPMSHGCVNMTNEDAQWLYNFGSIGTNVWVQY